MDRQLYVHIQIACICNSFKLVITYDLLNSSTISYCVNEHVSNANFPILMLSHINI